VCSTVIASTRRALEVAVDALLAHDPLDPVDLGDVTLSRNARTAAPVHLLDLGVDVVERPNRSLGGRLVRSMSWTLCVMQGRHEISKGILCHAPLAARSFEFRGSRPDPRRSV
jgi:hypothetical protein